MIENFEQIKDNQKRLNLSKDSKRSTILKEGLPDSIILLDDEKILAEKDSEGKYSLTPLNNSLDQLNLLNRQKYLIHQGFLQKAEQPREGELKLFKDGEYKFIQGHWKKLTTIEAEKNREKLQKDKIKQEKKEKKELKEKINDIDDDVKALQTELRNFKKLYSNLSSEEYNKQYLQLAQRIVKLKQKIKEQESESLPIYNEKIDKLIDKGKTAIEIFDDIKNAIKKWSKDEDPVTITYYLNNIYSHIIDRIEEKKEEKIKEGEQIINDLIDKAKEEILKDEKINIEWLIPFMKDKSEDIKNRAIKVNLADIDEKRKVGLIADTLKNMYNVYYYEE